MKITIIIEQEGSDNCIVHEASGFQEAIAALESFADLALKRRPTPRATDGLTVAALDNVSKKIKKVVDKIEARTARR